MHVCVSDKKKSYDDPDGSGQEIVIDEEKWTVTGFKETEKMSTYLVAFAVFDFSSKAHGRRIKVYHNFSSQRL